MTAPHQKNIYSNKLISAGQAAEILGLKESTLAQFRWRGDKRLPWVKLGKSIRYKLSDIESFIERSTIGKGA
ncbi:MAG: helix-turn-helix domain-containing protein [Colwellia polaris]|jgi:predicted DNA-binding transcriptional regulator AlpA|tara:strand:- start:4 stop:219 length:216 start_codon:yes stop_codon:yes gene_type:complete